MKVMKSVKILTKPKKKVLTSIKRKKTEVLPKKKLAKVKQDFDDGGLMKVKKSVNKLKLEKPKVKKNTEKPKLKKKIKQTKSHKEQLDSLKDLDPEFYHFLKQNDKKLLEFNLFDSDTDDEEQKLDVGAKKIKQKQSKQKEEEELSVDENNELSDYGEEDPDNDKYHKPSAALEVASDESDFEDNTEDTIAADGTQKITLNLLRQWETQLEKTNVSIDVVRTVIQAFNSALASISTDGEEQKVSTPFKVVGSAVFNGVIQLCVLHLQPAIMRLLGMTPQTKIPLHKTKKWVKVRGCLRHYLSDLIRLVEQVSSANILGVLLKHLHQMAAMIASFSTLGKTILKRLIVLWATSDETVRVLAFLCILKITRNQQVTMLHHVLKAMYLSYVRNSKFVSPNTLPGINFMRRSLVEMFALDLNVSYQHAFLYIRQLAIHLRNAVILKKKDSFQAVYNWQFVNSLRLWSDLLGVTTNKPQLQPLIYPLVTIATGVIRLVPTAQYFPLRFHCIQSLISLAKETSTYVPILPLIVEVLRSNTFNRKHTAVSMRPLQFTCILRLNKSQLAENGFRDEVVDQVCGMTLEYLAHESASLAFSDLVVPTVMALKAYLKECRNANYSRKLKQLLDKIQENGRFIEQERNKITFALNDLAAVQAWETHVRNKRTPLDIYYVSWQKTHETKKRRQAAQTDSINSDYDLPVVKRATKNVVPVKNDDGEVELFPSDSEGEDVPTKLSEDEVEAPAKKKPKKQKTTKKTKVLADKVPIEEEEDDDNLGVDIVKDLDLNDW